MDPHPCVFSQIVVHTKSEEMALKLQPKRKPLGHGCVINKSLRQSFGVSVDFHIDEKS